MHKDTGQIGPLDGFAPEDRKNAVLLNDEQLKAAYGMNRAERRKMARGIRRREGSKGRRK